MAITRLQTFYNSSGTNYVQQHTISPQAPIIANAFTQGSFLLMFILSSAAADPVVSVKDSSNNTWNRAGTPASKQNLTGSWWYCFNTQAGRPTITITGNGYYVWDVIVREFSGVAGTNPIDIVSAALDGGFVQSHALGPTASTVQADEFAVASYAHVGSFSDWTTPSGYTNSFVVTQGAEIKVLQAEKVLSSAGTQSTTWSTTQFTQGFAQLITLKAASGNAPSVPAAVTNLVATPGDTVARLDWSDSAGATSYKVFRSTTGGVKGSRIDNVVEPPVGGRVSLPNFPLIFDEDFPTTVAEGGFFAAYGTKWDAYPTDYPTTHEQSNPGQGDHQGGDTNISVVSGISGANGNCMKLRLHRDGTGPVVASCPEIILPGNTKFQAYGRYEFRYKMDAVAGYYSAWLLWNERNDLDPGDPQYLPWPQSGETDFLEGSLTTANAHAYMHHYGGTTGGAQDEIDYGVPMADSVWHTVAFEWKPGEIKFYMDGVLKGTSTGAKVPPDRMRVAMMNETNPSGTQPAASSTCNVYVDYASVWSYTPTVVPAGQWKLAVDPNISLQGIKNNYSGARRQKIDYIIAMPAAKWFGPDAGWDPNAVNLGLWCDEADRQGARAAVVLYGIPGRDNYGASAGGSTSQADYYTWITKCANAIGNRFAVITLEPDSIGLSIGKGAAEEDARMATIKHGIEILRSICPNITIYLDNVHPAWHAPATMAPYLVKAGVALTNGLNENVSNFQNTADCQTHAEGTLNILASQYGITGKGYVVDSSRNGNTTNPPGCDWRNPVGRMWGQASRYNPSGGLDGRAQKHGEIWIKVPGESDGVPDPFYDSDCALPPWLPEPQAGQLYVPWLEQFIDNSTIPA